MAEKSVSIDWPVADYVHWIKNPGQFEWTAFKLRSAEFYIDTLAVIGERHGFDRLAGVEMALDAGLAALSGAFDASIAELIESIELHCSQGGAVLPWLPVPQHEYGWNACNTTILPHFTGHAVIGNQIKSLRARLKPALRRRPDKGWLTELRDLRNRSTHHTTLSRHYAARVGGTNPGTDCRIILSDGSAVHPVDYLRGAREHLLDLTAQVEGLSNYFRRYGTPTASIEGERMKDGDTLSATIYSLTAAANVGMPNTSLTIDGANGEVTV